MLPAFGQDRNFILLSMGNGVVGAGSTSTSPVLVPAGSPYQLVWAGPDGVIDPPDPSNMAGGFVSNDDMVLLSDTFGMDFGFGADNLQGNLDPATLPNNAVIYGRFLGDTPANIAAGTAYRDIPPGGLTARTSPATQPTINTVDQTAFATFNITEFGGNPVNEFVVLLDQTIDGGGNGCVVLQIDVTDDCDGNSGGSATVTASGGSGNYSYNWDAAANNQTTATATGLGAGDYVVTVTDNGNGLCTSMATATVSGVCFGFMVDTTASDCPSAANGEAVVTDVTGAMGNLTYTWNTTPDPGNVDTASGLAPGDYSVVLTDGAGQSATQDFTIATMNQEIGFSLTKVDPTCGAGVSSGSITINGLTGGSGNYLVSYSGGNAGAQSGMTATGLQAAAYMVTVTDAEGPACSHTESITLTVDGSLPQITCSTNITVSLCPTNYLSYDPQAAGLVQGEAGDNLAAGSTSIVDNTGMPCTLIIRYSFVETNECGSSPCSVDVTFENPGLSLPSPLPAAIADQSLDCDADMPAPAVAALEAALAPCGTVTITPDRTLPGLCRSTANWTYTIVDQCGNTLVHTQTFTYAADTTGPTLDPIAQVDLQGCNAVPAPDNSVVTGTDDCGNGGIASVVLQSETTVAIADGRSELTRTWAASDACGNTSTVDQVITFVDADSVPVFANLPQVVNASGCNSLVPDMSSATPGLGLPEVQFSAGQAGVVITQSILPGTALTQSGIHRILVVAENVCANSATSYIDIVVDCPGTEPISVSGIKFNDQNGNGVLDATPGEFGLSGVTIFVDADLDGVFDPEFERSTVTGTDGSYTIDGLASLAATGGRGNGGGFNILEVVPPGFVQTAPAAGGHFGVLTSTTDAHFGNQGDVDTEIVVFIDLNENGENDDSSGIPSVRVTVCLEGDTNTILEAMTDADGIAVFSTLPPGVTYQFKIDETTLPPAVRYLGDNALTRTAMISTSGSTEPMALQSVPTAVTLESFRAEGDTITWTTAAERGTLGFFVHRRVGDETTQVNEALVLGVGGGTYSVVDADAPSGVQVEYILEEIETDLGSQEYGPAILVHAATPQGGDVASEQSDNGAVDLVTGDHDSYLILNVAADAELEDVTDPDNPIPLSGEVLETDSGTARYLSWPAGRTIRSK